MIGIVFSAVSKSIQALWIKPNWFVGVARERSTAKCQMREVGTGQREVGGGKKKKKKKISK